MPVINPSKKEINFKIVYFGPALSGKTTTLQQLHNQIKSKKKSKVAKIPKTEKTHFFDFLALSSDGIKGYKTRFQIYTVPGQPLYENSRRLILKGVDGVIFVADSQLDRLQDNIDCMEELKGHLKKMGSSLHEVPMIIQYNKRDLNTACPLEEIRKVINTVHVPDYESIAIKGNGILYPFQECLRQVVLTLENV